FRRALTALRNAINGWLRGRHTLTDADIMEILRRSNEYVQNGAAGLTEGGKFGSMESDEQAKASQRADHRGSLRGDVGRGGENRSGERAEDDLRGKGGAISPQHFLESYRAEDAALEFGDGNLGQEYALYNLARKNGWLVSDERLNQLKQNEHPGGMEHRIFIDRANERIYKLTRPGRWGVTGSPQEYLESITAFAQAAPFLVWNRKWSRKERRAAQQEFLEYFKKVDAPVMEVGADGGTFKRGARGGERMLNTEGYSPAAQELIKLWQQTAQDMHVKNRANRLVVWDAKEGRFRPIGSVANYFPRTLKPEIRRLLQDPTNNKKLFDQVVAELIKGGYIKSAGEALKFLNSKFSGSSSFDYFSNIETARETPLPTMMYDYSFDAARRYMMSWCERMGQIEAYGRQRARQEHADGGVEGAGTGGKLRLPVQSRHADAEHQQQRNFVRHAHSSQCADCRPIAVERQRQRRQTASALCAKHRRRLVHE
ncbi:MAG: hypothetical protein LBD30_02350, partial [Verrucomicrobiales bacterium]|nr:hypothetical protein [Verrucomicrobiales bacterium]